MPQAIQTFSDLTAIDCSDRLKVELEVRPHGQVRYDLSINGIKLYGDFSVLYFDLFDPIDMCCEILSVTEGFDGLEIVSLKVNGLSIVPPYQAHASSENIYLDAIGTWTLNIPPPFYTWYHLVSGQGSIF
jgi:hypothetical protein